MITNFGTVDGFFDFAEVYDELARNMYSGAAFAEIGVYRGASIIWLANRLKELEKDVKLYAIDIWKGRSDKNIFFSNCVEYGVAPMIHPIQAPSDIALLSFPAKMLWGCYIDGDHSFEQTRKDIENAMRVSTDVVAGHDYHLSSVSKAVKYMIGDRYEVRGNSWIYRL